MATGPSASERLIAGRVQLTRLLWGPREFRFSAPLSPTGGRLEVDAVFEAGRYRCRRVCFEAADASSEPITAETLRSVSLSNAMFGGLWPQIWHGEPTGAGGMVWTPMPLVAPGRPPELTDEVLRIVAAIYTAAYATGQAPMTLVMDVFELPRATAGRWVAKAREQGLLGATTERKAGGVD